MTSCRRSPGRTHAPRNDHAEPTYWRWGWYSGRALGDLVQRGIPLRWSGGRTDDAHVLKKQVNGDAAQDGACRVGGHVGGEQIGAGGHGSLVQAFDLPLPAVGAFVLPLAQLAR